MTKRFIILGCGVALYAIGMWLAWFDEQSSFGRAPSEWAHHEKAIGAFVLTGICAMLLGAISLGLKLSNGKRALGGLGIICLPFVLVWLWNHDVAVLEPNIHGWSAGFVVLPLLLLVVGGAWLLMAIGGALRLYWKRRAGARRSRDSGATA